MAIELRNLKGTGDFMQEEQRVRQNYKCIVERMD